MSASCGAKLTNPQAKQVLSRYGKGETSFALARAYGVSPSAIRELAKRNGVRSGRKPKIDMAALQRMVEEGARRRDLEDYFAVSGAAVLKAKRRLREAA